MKKCEHQGCETDIEEKYSFCYEHFKTGKKTDMKSKGQWHEDPVVDALLKINANLGRIGESLDRWGERPEPIYSKKDVHDNEKGEPLVPIDDLEDDPRE